MHRLGSARSQRDRRHHRPPAGRAAGGARAGPAADPRGPRAHRRSGAGAHPRRGGERARQVDRAQQDLRHRPPSSRRRNTSSARAGSSSTTRRVESLDEIGGLETLKAWLQKRRGAFTSEGARLRAAAAQGHPADRRARLRQVAHGQGGRRGVADAASASRRRQDLRRPGRRVGGEHPQGDQDRRGDRPGGPVARRDGEGLLRHRLVEHVRRRHDLARVRHLRHLDAGEDLAGVRHRHRERRAVAAARAHAQGALRRDLLRRSADARGAPHDPRDPPARRSSAIRRALDLPRVVDAMPEFSGAEIEQAVISALYDAFDADRELTHRGDACASRARSCRWP